MKPQSNNKGNFPSVAQETTAQVDWLTVTTKDWPVREELFALQMDMVKYHSQIGNRIHPWKFKGYQGIRAQGFRWGRRDDSDIVMLSGVDAQTFWPMALQLGQNISRIDLAVTVLVSSPLPDWAWGIYQTLEGAVDGKKPCRRMTFYKNNTGGQTLYVGSRASDQFGRLYDKGREAVEDLAIDPGLLWRYEVEFKGKRAKTVALQLRRQLGDVGTIPGMIAKTVQLWFFSRGVPILDVVREGDLLDLEVSARVTDDTTTLDWLSNQVRPSVLRLKARGKMRQVVKALGLDEFDKWEETGYTGSASTRN
jgi:Putative phage replication protein RstA